MKTKLIPLAAFAFATVVAAQPEADMCTQASLAQGVAVMNVYGHDGSEAFERSVYESVLAEFLNVKTMDPRVKEFMSKALIEEAKKALQRSKPLDTKGLATLAMEMANEQGRKCREIANRADNLRRDRAEKQSALAVKGYVVGQPLPFCPAGSKPQESTQPKAVVTCEFGPTSYGGANAKNFSLFLFEGKVLGALVDFGFGGKHNHFTLHDALVQKYGPPSESRKSVNTYTWQQGTVSLTLNGLEGLVTLHDQTAFESAKKASAYQAKDDL